LNESLGSEVVQEIEFKIGIPRRGPQRAQQIVSRDEADQIPDPVMRQIYKSSRKKALA
jgi:hypothetical protein